MQGDLQVLSGEGMQGRRTGSPGGDRAAAFLAGEMARLGLEPAGAGGRFLEPFDVILGTRLGRDNRLSRGPGVEGILGRDFAPYSYSSDGEGAGPVVFAGFGLSAPRLGWDDYEGLEVRGAYVLLVDGEPNEKDPDSPFRVPEAFRFRDVRHKAVTARDRGARGVLVVPRPGDSRRLLASGEGPAGSRAGIPVVAISREFADRVLTRGGGAGLARRVAAIEASRRPASEALAGPDLELGVDVDEIPGTGYNVVGRIPGREPGAGAVLVGAHYDHLGTGGESSLDPDAVGAVHHGADDNASGTVAMLAVAREMLRRPPRRDVLVAAFGGEEMGLLGSAAFVKRSEARTGGIHAMVNMDMVGRMKPDRALLVHGVGTAEGLRELVDGELRGLGLKGGYSGDGYGPSDHTSFYAAGIPVLFFFTGPHVDYHRPSDTWEKIDPSRLALVARAVGRVTRRLADLPARLALVKATAPPPGRGRGGGGGYGPYFGSIPDFTEHEGGVLLSGVRAGSPAESAGVRGGDLLVGFGGKTIENLHDLTYALRGFRPGDRIEVVVERGGRRLPPMQATLGSRKKR